MDLRSLNARLYLLQSHLPLCCWNEGERVSIPFSGLVRALWVSRVSRDLIDSIVSLSLLRCDC